MNPQSHEQAGLNLPAPMIEQAPTPAAPERAPISSERSSAEVVGAKQPTANPAPAVPFTVPLPAAMPTTPPAIPSPAPTATITNDADDIETAWVQKAKDIIARTSQDPYRRSQEIASMRAEYMQRNYNKTLKSEQAA